jgi:hypothetical protein
VSLSLATSSDEVMSLPPALSNIESLLPLAASSADELSATARVLHLPSPVLRFLFAVSVDAIRRFAGTARVLGGNECVCRLH